MSVTQREGGENMHRKDSATKLGNQSEQPSDLRDLWDRWDEVQKEESSSRYHKGWNLAGLGLLTIGTCFMVWGVGYLKITGPILITLGALILGVKRVKSFWQRRSLVR